MSTHANAVATALGVFLVVGSWSASVEAQSRSVSGWRTVTIYVDEGATSSQQSVAITGSKSPNLGHVFVDLYNGQRHTIIGYYGDPSNPARGQLRPDADLISKNGWTIKSEPYALSERGSAEIHALIDNWGTDGLTWWVTHNCADFGEAVARIANLPLGELTKLFGHVNTPSNWAAYLREHGGRQNPANPSKASPPAVKTSSLATPKAVDGAYNCETAREGVAHFTKLLANNETQITFYKSKSAADLVGEAIAQSNAAQAIAYRGSLQKEIARWTAELQRCHD